VVLYRIGIGVKITTIQKQLEKFRPVPHLSVQRGYISFKEYFSQPAVQLNRAP
jgi:hypothetical protein